MVPRSKEESLGAGCDARGRCAHRARAPLIVIRDACGAGHHDAGERSIATLQYLGDALVTMADEFATVLRPCHSGCGHEALRLTSRSMSTLQAEPP
jgi:hypothetical protein